VVGTLALKGEPVPADAHNLNRSDLDFTGSVMPPPDAVAGTYKGPDGKAIKVEPLSDEDRRTIIRWIDLGCPIDLEHDPADPQKRGYGWHGDDQRPTLAVTYPQPGANPPLSRIVVGFHDAYTGIDPESLTVTADFAIDGVPAGENLAAKFQPISEGVFELKLATPITDLATGALTTSIKDRQGNITRIERTFSIPAR
jgi:hypothetical protein